MKLAIHGSKDQVVAIKGSKANYLLEEDFGGRDLEA